MSGLLWGHISRSTNVSLYLNAIQGLFRALRPECETEVSEDKVSFFIDEEVFWFDVSMDNAGSMQKVDGADLEEQNVSLLSYRLRVLGGTLTISEQ